MSTFKSCCCKLRIKFDFCDLMEQSHSAKYARNKKDSQYRGFTHVMI